MNACPQPRQQNQGRGQPQNNNEKGKKQTVQVKQGHLNFTTMVGIPKGAVVMMGTFSIHGKPIKILFDSGATHSFINQSTQVNLGLNVLRVKNEFKIATLGGNISSNTLVKSVPLQLGSKTLGLDGIDVILGMDWMTHHKVLLDIAERRIEITSPAVGVSTLYLPLRGSMDPSAYVSIATSLEEIPVVCDYPDVFADDLRGMPPDWDIEFVIELQPGTRPISKRAYRMAPKELAELKT
jgi:hypothetical protein